MQLKLLSNWVSTDDMIQQHILLCWSLDWFICLSVRAVFSRGHATLQLAVSVGPSVRRSVGHIVEFRAVSALLLLPNRPRLDCCVSGLVHITCSLDHRATGLPCIRAFENRYMPFFFTFQIFFIYFFFWSSFAL